jgi:hypothetical protein
MSGPAAVCERLCQLDLCCPGGVKAPARELLPRLNYVFAETR